VSGNLHAPAALIPPVRTPRYPLDRSLGGPHSRSVRGGEEKRIPASARNRTPVPQHIAYSPYSLNYPGSYALLPWTVVLCADFEIDVYSPVRPPKFSWTYISKNWEPTSCTPGCVTERWLSNTTALLVQRYCWECLRHSLLLTILGKMCMKWMHNRELVSLVRIFLLRNYLTD
jgi:hypothetical protein